MIAFTITIPDFLFNGHYWAGFGTAILLCVILFLYAANNFNPFG